MTVDLSETIRKTVQMISKPESVIYIGTKAEVRKAVEHFQIALFPAFMGREYDICKGCKDASDCHGRNDMDRRTIAFDHASNALVKALCSVEDHDAALRHTDELIRRMPHVHEMLLSDVLAAYQGDPAAESMDEVILSYPSFTAVSIHRIAHELYNMDIPVIPRIMSELAHELTGIDIHPGAVIGSHFFIDHGTGVVIGETSVIGDHVKIYQNVTLGAKSFPLGEDGNPVKGIKRHPQVGNNVVIYAGATILGGNTVIGDNCTIGGNTWITKSVPANTKVTI